MFRQIITLLSDSPLILNYVEAASPHRKRPLRNQRQSSAIRSAETRPAADCGSDHVRESEKANKHVRSGNMTYWQWESGIGLDLIDRAPDKLWKESRNVVQ